VLFALGRGRGVAFCFPKTKGYPPYPGGIQFESLAAVSSGIFGGLEESRLLANLL
jgi:hypothetical protein